MLNKTKASYYRYGLIAEYIAIIMLFLKGYNIIKRRYRNALGEIDIIAVKKKMLIFIEVKARKKFCDSLQIMTTRQKNRIISAAKLFVIHNNRYQLFDIRFDVIIFNGFRPLHKKNMW